MMILTEGYTLATYPETIMWAIATLAFVIMAILGYRSKNLKLKITLLLIGVLGAFFCAWITIGAYAEASGQVVQ